MAEINNISHVCSAELVGGQHVQHDDKMPRHPRELVTEQNKIQPIRKVYESPASPSSVEMTKSEELVKSSQAKNYNHVSTLLDVCLGTTWSVDFYIVCCHKMVYIVLKKCHIPGVQRAWGNTLTTFINSPVMQSNLFCLSVSPDN